jgi:hypothetical protein
MRSLGSRWQNGHVDRYDEAAKYYPPRKKYYLLRNHKTHFYIIWAIDELDAVEQRHELLSHSAKGGVHRYEIREMPSGIWSSGYITTQAVVPNWEYDGSELKPYTPKKKSK